MSDLASLVDVSNAVGSTPSRKTKTALLAEYLRSLSDGAAGPAVAYLSGVVPQGALGVGWATLSNAPPPAPAPSLQIEDVAAAFDRLAIAAGAGSNATRRAITAELFGAATEAEQRFLLGLIGGEVRQGSLEGSMVEAVAAAAAVPPDAVRRALMLNGRIWDVGRIALTEGEEGLAAVSLTLFQPVKPMLAQSAQDVTAAISTTGPARVEWKLDGIRIQIHRQGDQVEVYTRNLNRVTERLDEIADVVRSLPGESFVMDGEALWLGDGGRPARFQETAGRFGTGELPDRGLRPYLFDLLHLDGEDLIDRPLRERRERLEKVAGEYAVTGAETSDASAAAEVLADALAQGHEGVVVKGVESAYEAGRRGAAWVKVKPVHTLDLVVLAAEWGHGRRQGWLSNLHLGARHRDESGAEDFVMLGKTFKGLTDELLAWQTERLQQLEVRRTKGTVFVRPELVVEIALDGVQVSTRYPGGVALRFARVRTYRTDKDPSEADTLDTVRALGGLAPLG